jgi:hypothetical protein
MRSSATPDEVREQARPVEGQRPEAGGSTLGGPTSLPTERVLALQRAAGNRAVATMLARQPRAPEAAPATSSGGAADQAPTPGFERISSLMASNPGMKPELRATLAAIAPPSVPGDMVTVPMPPPLVDVEIRWSEVSTLLGTAPPADTARLKVFGARDVVHQICEIQKPGDVADWWAREPKAHPDQWAHPLSEWEQYYITAFRSPDVPTAIQMREPVDPAHLTAEDAQRATALFGTDPASAQLYANFENRRRIMAHYVLSHPATVRLQLGLYRLIRDVNPIHFAFERGWQIGSGKEMFTDRDVSRLGAAGEFLLALALGVAVDKAVAAARMPVAGTGPGWATPEVENAFRAAVRARGEELMSTLSRAERGPVLSGALDTRTGRTYFGINQGEIPPNLHPLLRQRLTTYLSDTGGVTPAQAGVAGSHSEIVALNKALYAREAALGRPVTEAELGEFVIHNKSLWPSRPEGVPPPCVNCANILPPSVKILP